jgi:hypothetical protein
MTQPGDPLKRAAASGANAPRIQSAVPRRHDIQRPVACCQCATAQENLFCECVSAFTFDNGCSLERRGCPVFNEQHFPKFVDHAYSGSQTHPCSHHAVAIYPRALGSAPNLCKSRPPEQTPSCATRARRGFLCGMARPKGGDPRPGPSIATRAGVIPAHRPQSSSASRFTAGTPGSSS